MKFPLKKMSSNKKTWLITGAAIGILLIAVLLVFFFRPLFSAYSTSAPLSEAYYAEFDGTAFTTTCIPPRRGIPPLPIRLRPGQRDGGMRLR